MGRNNYLILILVFLVSCITDRKVEVYLNNNPNFAAEQCNKRFPIKEDTEIEVTVDTAQYEHSIRNLKRHLDSIGQIAEERNVKLESAKYLIDKILQDRDYSEQALQQLRDKINSIKTVDIEAIKK